MGKVIKAVAIGFVVGLTGGFILPYLGMAAPFAGAFGITSATLAAAAGTAFWAGVSALTTEYLTKKAGDLNDAQNKLNLSANPQALGVWVFGETAAATDIIYAEVHGAKKDYATQIVACAAHTISEFGDMYVNDELVTFSGSQATGTWADVLCRQVKLGTEDQTAIDAIDGSDTFSWPSTSTGAGMAHYRLRWKLGADKLSGGLPSRITQIVKGAPVYDPRRDSSRGGSGDHRFDDQTTWAFADGDDVLGSNWALIVLFYLIGWHVDGKLVFGMGVDPEEIDFPQVMAAANICDEIVDELPRYRIGGLMSCHQDHPTTMGQLEASTGGKVSYIGGKYYIWAPNDDLIPFLEITDADIIRDAGIEFIPSGPIENLYNTATGRYIEPADLYQAVPYPEISEDTAVSEDGRLRILDQDYALIQDVSIAQRVSRELIRRSRFSAIWRFSMGPKALGFRPFSITTLNIKETDYEGVTVRIINMAFSPAGVVVVECVEEDSSIYDTSLPLGTPVTSLDPNAFDPASQIAVENLLIVPVTLAGDAGTFIDAYHVTWDDPGSYVRTTQIQYKQAISSIWIDVPVSTTDFTSAIIIGAQPLTLHDLRIRHISLTDVYGPWTEVQGTTGGASPTYTNLMPKYYKQSFTPSGQGEREGDFWLDDTDHLWRYNGSSWVDAQDQDIAQALTDAALAYGLADGKIATWYQDSPPSDPAVSEGDVWFDTDDGNAIYRYTSSSWVFAQDDAVAQAIDDAADAQATADGKVTTFVGTSPPTAEGVGDIWMDTDDNNRLYRWNGSSWADHIQDLIGRNHSVSTGNVHSTTLAQITPLLSASGTTVISGVGNDFVMETNSSNAVFKHKFASLSSVGAYSGTLRTGLFVGANGITMGYNRKSDGNWVESITLDGTTGKATFTDDIVTSGQVYASGLTSYAGQFYAIVGAGASRGIYGEGSSFGLYGYATGVGQGVFGAANHAASYGVWGSNSPGIGVRGSGATGGSFAGTTTGIDVSGQALFNSGVFMSNATANFTIGGATNTGNANICIKQGAAGGKTSGQIQLYGANSSGSKTTLGIVAHEDVVAGTGPFTGLGQIKILINAVEYWWPLNPV